ncbi:hypothetical protein [Crenobacter cavernae]|uniref:hypothetical protein n=1 Tax=Crenobacter cavernae TaxID=2290923 RepID=UPI0011C05F57|nr:hypothetical protein [Crenobacter cavernae]
MVFVSVGCSTPNISKSYTGPERPINEVAVYSPNNRGDFNGPSILTTHLNGKILREYFSEIPFGPYISMVPGDVEVRVTFDDYEDVFLWVIAPNVVSLKTKNFKGHYDIKFNAKPGKFYAPIFNYNLPQEKRILEMCISELNMGSSLAETRVPQKYVACGKPSIPAIESNIKICAEIYKINEPPKLYDEMCREVIKLK